MGNVLSAYRKLIGTGLFTTRRHIYDEVICLSKKHDQLSNENVRLSNNIVEKVSGVKEAIEDYRKVLVEQNKSYQRFYSLIKTLV